MKKAIKTNRKNLKKIIFPCELFVFREKGFIENIGFQDEMRVGLLPCTRRVWSKKGERPISYHQNKYEWLYVYLVVFPFKKESFTLFLPTVNTECEEIFWFEFLKTHRHEKYLILWDNAGFHRGINREKFPNLQFLSLPPYSPELNPAETVWPVYREFISNKFFQTMDDLEKELTKAFWYIEENKDNILSRTQFHWIMGNFQ